MTYWGNKIKRDWSNAKVKENSNRWGRVMRIRKILIVKHAKVYWNTKAAWFEWGKTENWWRKAKAWKLEKISWWRKNKTSISIANYWERNPRSSLKSFKTQKGKRSMVKSNGRKRINKMTGAWIRKTPWEIKIARILR